ncbi:MAG: SDR family NAD(P)-dependent oxidoreductase, partial [Planctomycetota bacterium]|nr:SDR family NAD(P)-dependent oxidoreductase [Planctomycetota bacterium]
MVNDGSLSGRAAMVTGASQGLGLAVAKTFAQAGAELVICARNGKKLAEAREEIANAGQVAGRRILAIATDVSRPDEVTALVERARHEFPHLSVLVNNAGV